MNPMLAYRRGISDAIRAIEKLRSNAGESFPGWDAQREARAVAG
jgi:hypothetical protein